MGRGASGEEELDWLCVLTCVCWVCLATVAAVFFLVMPQSYPSYPLPDDVKAMFLLSDGWTVSWSLRTTASATAALRLGCLHMNSLTELRKQIAVTSEDVYGSGQHRGEKVRMVLHRWDDLIRATASSQLGWGCARSSMLSPFHSIRP